MCSTISQAVSMVTPKNHPGHMNTCGPSHVPNISCELAAQELETSKGEITIFAHTRGRGFNHARAFIITDIPCDFRDSGLSIIYPACEGQLIRYPHERFNAHENEGVGTPARIFRGPMSKSQMLSRYQGPRYFAKCII